MNDAVRNETIYNIGLKGTPADVRAELAFDPQEDLHWGPRDITRFRTIMWGAAEALSEGRPENLQAFFSCALNGSESFRKPNFLAELMANPRSISPFMDRKEISLALELVPAEEKEPLLVGARVQVLKLMAPLCRMFASKAGRLGQILGPNSSEGAQLIAFCKEANRLAKHSYNPPVTVAKHR